MARRRARRNKERKPSAAATSIAPQSPWQQRHAWLAGLALFALALIVRLLFWKATADATWSHTAYFKGDAPIWLDYARAMIDGRSFEMGLPIHPPGTAYLMAALWDGEIAGLPFVRLVWIILGAAVVALVYVAVLRSFGFVAACVAGLISAASSGLMILSTSLNSETPYLFLVLAALCLFEDLRARPRFAPLAAWSALNALACLVRAEHVIFYALNLGFFAFLWARRDPLARSPQWRASFTETAVSLVFFVLPLVPWHVKTWRGIERFNTVPLAFHAGEETALRRVEQRLEGLTWNAGAVARREQLPAFTRRTSALFVAATVAYRGGREVRGEDFGVLEEAFGYIPRPLTRFPFVSLYGPINFALANHPGATGGFSADPLGEPPPFAPAAGSYPPDLVSGLPPPQLSFLYPPHLQLFNEGYGVGWKWIRERPGRFLGLALRKLRIFCSGAATGFTGYNLPLGLSGLRRAVDMVTSPGSWLERLWCLAVLAVCILGVRAGRQQMALYPWLLFLASKLVVTVLFFGYARQGATVIPVAAVLAGVAASRWLAVARTARPQGCAPRAVLVAAMALAGGLELGRFLSAPAVSIDGRVAGAQDPFPDDFSGKDRRIEVR